MHYCPPNTTFNDVWINQGINKCFFYTVPVALLAIYFLVISAVQFVRYIKHGKAHGIRSTISFGYVLQQCCMFLMGMICAIPLVLHLTLSEDRTVYGYRIFFLVINTVVWILNSIHIHLEKNYVLNERYLTKHSWSLQVFWIGFFLFGNLTFVNVKSNDWWFYLNSVSDKIDFSVFLAQYFLASAILFLGFKSPGIPKSFEYIRFSQATESSQNNSEESTWKSAWKKATVLVPYMWPKNNIGLQLIVLICCLALIAGRVINVFVPIYYKLIVNALGGSGDTPEFCWQLILVYVIFKIVQGGGTGGVGILNNMRTLLWTSVQQYTTREVQLSLFSHLHSLSLRWHLSRKTGEVMRIMDRGTTSINTLFSYIVFNILPTIFDISIAVIYFTTMFSAWFGLIVFLTMVLYLVLTIVITEWRTKFRRSMNLADNEQKTKSMDSVLNYETVKYYGAELYERERYLETILNYQKEEWRSNASLCLLNTLQNIVINGGLLAGSLLCAWMVSTNSMTVGDYVLFSTYILQLYTPLNWFGTYYLMIQQNFIDMENMFDLMDEKEEVTDSPNALALIESKGDIDFKDVHFSYVPEKPILKGLTFSLEKGKTLAIVGPSGAGKSTIMRLLFRFFDIQHGAICVDGLDIKQYKQNSLRKAMGVVPQDTVLFNDTILYNIRYGRVSANSIEVIEAAQNAEIHDSIMNFPDQYDSRVGERGLKLSGGEKQRIAIARTILKDPSIILLDEATSALDTRTERNIQSALLKICAGRTTVIVAHRLSTIVHADTILVLKDGLIVEKGSHEELLAINGEYTSMWRQQLEANNNADVIQGDETS